jgi:hypothetical protein
VREHRCIGLGGLHSGSAERRGREAHKARIDAVREPEIIDNLHVIERAARHFFIRAEMGVNAGRKQSEIDQDYKQAAALAALAAPYRHARISAMKIMGDPNAPVHFKDDASAEELREEIELRLNILQSAGLIELQVLPPQKAEVANQLDCAMRRPGGTV